MLTTKIPKATVGGLSPSKGYILQIFELTGLGKVLLAQREFVSLLGPLLGFPSLGVARRLQLSPVNASGLAA